MQERKEEIRRAFARAAATYDAHAVVQAEAAAHLARLLDGIRPQVVLELGCATGSFTEILAHRFPEAFILALDFAEPMLAVAVRKLAGHPRVEFRCKDAEAFLERTADTFDLIAANAALQWLADIETGIANLAKVLTSSGTLVCSLFGPRTFRELGQALSVVLGREASLPGARFPTGETLSGLLARYFGEVTMETVSRTREYASVRHLLKTMKNTGASGGGRSQVGLTPARVRAVDAWMAASLGGCRVTYEFFLVRASRPIPRKF